MADTDALITRDAAEAALFGTRDGTCLFAPIRHHSPACAWMLRAMIDDHQPELILIEAPRDLIHHVPFLTDPETVAPVAIVSLGAREGQSTRAVRYFPFSDHSPELLAIRQAAQIGADVQFIDLPAGRHFDDDVKIAPFQSEIAFDTATFVRATCSKLGLRDGAELWDHLFETRLGQSDWRGFFSDVYAYCLALRETTAPDIIVHDDTLTREAEMRAHIAAAQGKRVIVLTGGFHTPALIQPGDEKPAKSSDVESYLIGYGEEALDALSGYGAGLRYPGWYAGLWQSACAANGSPDWSAHALETSLGFAAQMAGDNRRVAVPQLVEMLGMAEGLARLKGREAILLPDLFDGLRSALIKTEAGPGEPFSQRLHAYLRGTKLGKVPKSAGQPPIVADARARAQTARVDLSDSIKRAKKLDIRRKPTHLKTSQFFYQMGLLNTGFASLETGPDFVIGSRIDLLFEEWLVGWSPFVEGALIDAARLGATLPEAAANHLFEQRQALFEAGRGNDLSAILDLLLAGLRAGLGSDLTELADEMRNSVSIAADFDALAQIIQKLQSVSAPGDPLFDENAPDLVAILTTAFDRMVYLIEDLTETTEDAMPDRIASLGIVAAVLRGPQADRFDGQTFTDALTRILAIKDCPPMLAGALAGLLVRAGLYAPETLAHLLQGNLRGIGSAPEDRAALLMGLLSVAPMVLWQNQVVLDSANAAISELDEDIFVAALPSLRRSLTQLNPHETDRLAEELAALFGVQASSISGVKSRFTEQEAARALAIDRAMDDLLIADGLTHWKAF
ncbi:DUF5682 family protein [Parasulfitobacter algicola]|uniref:Uncharacterized protein n=1 Tax=Parasulfitobacter algicola TaxID=2614809 RepID=A0ABX2IN74_9RHOB|nr:DUF5682 family protein [Sulfitobacter algicola]NSX53426.1 hypothetical protein [Sulfitobacter algicola]